jgi:membrane protein YdbS with pleckstrin-like domain
VTQLGVADSLVERITGDPFSARRVVSGAFRALAGATAVPFRSLALAIAAIVLFLLFVRLISMAWALVRLHGFSLTRHGDDLRTEFGLLTHIVATVPVRRVQTVTIRERPLHRLFRRASLRVTTAGGGSEAGNATAEREWLAPIVRREEVQRLLAELLPEVDLPAVNWNGVHPRALRRAVKPRLVLAVAAVLPFVAFLGWWNLALLAVFVAWAVVSARLYVAHLAWGVTDTGAMVRSGSVWRYVTIARFVRLVSGSVNRGVSLLAPQGLGKCGDRHRRGGQPVPAAHPLPAARDCEASARPARRSSRRHDIQVVVARRGCGERPVIPAVKLATGPSLDSPWPFGRRRLPGPPARIVNRSAVRLRRPTSSAFR